MPFLIFLIFVPIFWLMIYRPQQQQRRAHQEVVAALAVGQQVMTVGGLIGTLTRVDAETVTLDAGDGVELTFGRTFIRQQVDLVATDHGTDQGDQVHDQPTGDAAGHDLDEGAA